MSARSVKAATNTRASSLKGPMRCCLIIQPTSVTSREITSWPLLKETSLSPRGWELVPLRRMSLQNWVNLVDSHCFEDSWTGNNFLKQIFSLKCTARVLFLKGRRQPTQDCSNLSHNPGVENFSTKVYVDISHFICVPYKLIYLIINLLCLVQL